MVSTPAVSASWAITSGICEPTPHLAIIFCKTLSSPSSFPPSLHFSRAASTYFLVIWKMVS